MNKINIFACLIGGALALSSCEKYDDLVPAEYHNVLNIKHYGLQKITLYTTGEDPVWNFTVMKGGSEEGYKSSASINVMTEADYKEYSNAENVQAEYLPSEYYEIPETEFSFGAKETYKIVGVKFKAAEIKKLMDNTKKKYALPIVMSSDVSNVNNNIIVAQLNVETPTLGFDLAGGNLFVPGATMTQSGNEKATIEVNVNFSTVNQNFTFDAGVTEASKKVFEEYNATQDGKYNILPEAAYTLKGKGLSFPQDAAQMALSIEVDRTKLKCGEYILPLGISNVSNGHFKVDDKKSVVLVGVKYLPSKLNLTVDQLSTNSVEVGDGSGLAGLIDGDLTGGGYFHSKWSAPVVDSKFGNYIQVNLKAPISSLSFEYYTRVNNGNGAPRNIKLFTSNDGQTWTEWKQINKGLPGGGNMKYSSNIFVSETSFKYVRFAVLQSAAGSLTSGGGTYFNLHELTFYGN